MFNSFRLMCTCLFLITVTGCGASASMQAGTATPATASATARVDGFRKAINPETGKCERGRPGAVEADYTSCLEWRMQTMASVPLAAPQASSAGSTPPAPAAPPAAAPPAMPGVVAPGAGTVYVPAIGGATCDANASLEANTLKVWNNTPYAVEIQAPYVAPLNCDVPIHFVKMVVTRFGESTPREVLAIKPGATARYVFLPMNGGMGHRVMFWARAYNPLSVMGGAATMPSPEVSKQGTPATFSARVPLAGGNTTNLWPSHFEPGRY